jgi:hypothetical protein
MARLVCRERSANKQRASFVRPFSILFRRFRREFLEARIILQRIEHWIEPEQRGSERFGLARAWNGSAF